MTTTLKPNAVLIEEGQRLRNLAVILEGKVQIETPFGNFYLEKGDVIGLLDLTSATHSFTYRAIVETTLSYYNYIGPDSLSSLFKEESNLYSLCPRSMIRQSKNFLDLIQYIQYEAENLFLFLNSSYINYKLHSKANHISLKPLPELDKLISPEKEEHIHPWMIQYYNALEHLSPNEQGMFEKDTDLATGLLLNFSKDSSECMRVGSLMKEYQVTLSSLLLNEFDLDFFDLFSDLYIRVSKEIDPSPSFVASFHQLVNFLDTSPHINSAYWESRYKNFEQSLAAISLSENKVGLNPSIDKKLSQSFEQILAFSGCKEETILAFKEALQKYRDLSDRSDISDESRFLYKELASYFYTVYTSAFQVSLTNEKLPIVVKMFFNFGYIDEILCGIENAEYLYSITEKIKSDPANGIYTFYDWLLAIYKGEKEPSRNEFDMDYSDYLHELFISGKIDKTMENKMKQDNAQKVMYELDNCFPTVNKITYGIISNFTPLLSEHNILRPLPDTLVTANDIKAALKKVTSVDYSAFSREVVFSDTDIGITRDFVQKEVLPDIILMPNTGNRGITWQEIEGKHRDTPARMMLPILSLNDVSSVILRLTGDFRWEMCKRIQGARWNDVSDQSLTSSYFDYIQFYKKNSSLSSEAKEKIKRTLQRKNNSFKEAFVEDYISYILYEKNGIPKLNKINRDIFFTYCPFPEEIRSKLALNPLYTKAISSHTLRTKRELHRYDLLTKKITSLGKEIPKEIKNQITYLNK